MKYFKLGFKNKPVPEQIAICKRTIAGFKTQRAKVAGFRDDLVKVAALETLLAETEAALKRIAEGQLIVREGLAARKILLPRLLKAVTNSATGYFAAGDGSEAWLRSAALEVHAPRTRRVGQPAAPARMRGAPSEHEGAVQLRWKRPVRRCAFIVHMTTDPNATQG